MSDPAHEHREPTHDHDHHHDHHQGHRHAHGWSARLLHLITPHSHDATRAIQTAEEAAGLGIRTAWISLAGMGATAGAQIAIVAISGSIALLADTIHNVGHLVTTIPLILAFRLGRRAPTARYPFGFRRAEDLVGILIAAVIALSAAYIIGESIDALLNPRPLSNLGWVLAAGLVGALGNEIVAVYRIRAGRRIGSAALVAEGNHARADGLTSIAVVLGVVGVWLGLPQADAVVGLLIAGVILGILVQSIRSIARRLMDGVEDGTVERISEVAASVSGVGGVDAVRARWGGHRLETQLEIHVDGALTVAEAARIAERVRRQLVRTVPSLDRASIQLRPGSEGATPR